MIKQFNIKDLGAFLPNEYSNPDEIFPLFLDARYEVMTIWGNDHLVKAIICFRNYWGRCWSCFVLISESFNKADAVKLRELMMRYMDERKAVRLQTESRATATLRSWHEFLGFTCEGIKRKFMFNQDYDCWAIVREGV